MPVFFGRLTKMPRKLRSDRRSDEVWGSCLITSPEEYEGREMPVTGPLFELVPVVRLGALLSFSAELGPGPKGKGVGLHACRPADVALQAGVGDLAAVADRLGITLSGQEYRDCLAALGAANFYVASGLLDDAGYQERLRSAVGEETAEKFKALSQKAALDLDVVPLAALFSESGSGLDVPHAIRTVKSLRFRASYRKTTVYKIVCDAPWVLAQVLDDRGAAEAAAEKIAEHLGMGEWLRGELAAASAVLSYLLERSRQGDCFAWGNAVFARALSKGFSQESVKDAIAGLTKGHLAMLGEVRIEWDNDLLAEIARRTNRWPLTRGKPLEKEKLTGYYLPGIYYSEREAANKLVSMLLTPAADWNVERLAERLLDAAEQYSQGQYGVILDSGQKEFVRAVAENKVVVLTGEAGTGKTAVLKALIGAFNTLAPDRAPMVVAPTALAAYRAASRTVSEEYARTIHRYARYFAEDSDMVVDMPFNGPAMVRETDLVLVDESSMLGPVMLRKLLDRTKEQARIVFCGDPGQLPPVGPGGIFPGLIRLAQEQRIPGLKLVELTENHCSGESVIQAAQAVRRGQPIKFSEQVRLLEANSEIDVLDMCRKAVKESLNGNLFDPDRILVMAPTKSKGVGTDRLNKMLAAEFGGGREIRGTSFRVGDPVVAIRNDYAELGKGVPERIREMRPDRGDVYNGVRGVVSGVRANGELLVEVVFEIAGKRVVRAYRPEEMEFYLSPAYALTVYKMQGGRARNVILVLTQEREMRHRSLIYTGITRCMVGGRVTIIAPEPLKDAPYRHVPNKPDEPDRPDDPERIMESEEADGAAEDLAEDLLSAEGVLSGFYFRAKKAYDDTPRAIEKAYQEQILDDLEL